VEEVPKDKSLDTKVRRRGSRYALVVAICAAVALALFLALRLGVGS
jgi:hypothetical protein